MVDWIDHVIYIYIYIHISTFIHCFSLYMRNGHGQDAIELMLCLHGEKFILDSKRNIIESKRNFALSESQVDFLLHFKRSLLFDFNLIFHLNISRLSLYNGQQTSPWNNEKTSYYSVDWSLDTNRDEIEIYSSCRIDTRIYFYLNVSDM